MTFGQRPFGRILITGARGFLGATLVSTLRQQGADLVATDVPRESSAADAIVPFDITDGEAALAILTDGQFDTVFHCGAVSGPMVMADRPRDIWRINVDGTANVLDAAWQAGVGRVVFCSSIDVYGTGPTGLVGEAERPNPVSVYGASKVAAEAAVLGYRREHGLDVLALRLGWIYGPGRTTPTTLATLLQNGIKGAPTTVTGDPDSFTHYIHVEDAVDALLRAAGTPDAGEHWVFNATAGAGLKFAAVLDHVRALVPGGRIELVRESQSAIGPAGFDQRLAKAVLGFEARIDFSTGLRRYWQSLGGSRAD